MYPCGAHLRTTVRPWGRSPDDCTMASVGLADVRQQPSPVPSSPSRTAVSWYEHGAFPENDGGAALCAVRFHTRGLRYSVA
jgi:hypothetical protein